VSASPATLNNPGSRSERPDLDWSQVKETIAMLCLAMGQIESTLTDSSRSVGDLTDIFTRMANEARSIHRLASDANDLEGWKAAREEILNISQGIDDRMALAVVAFQFYDRLSQKLSRVNRSLTHLGDLIGNSQRVFDPVEWRKLQKEIRSNYGMECERLMFDMIMQGATIERALELYRHQFDPAELVNRDPSDDDVELF